MGIFSKMKGSIEARKAEKEKKLAEEKARQEKISSGDIKPIQTDYNLDKGEKAYITFPARKMGQVARTVSSTHKQGVVGNSCCGCCMLGPLGALLGGIASPSKTSHNTVDSTESLDDGTMVFTNRRFLFVGKKSMIGLEYKKMMSIDFRKEWSGMKLDIKYPEMANGEHYILYGDESKVANLWYEGIKKIK
jgi:hypothetical protein